MEYEAALLAILSQKEGDKSVTRFNEAMKYLSFAIMKPVSACADVTNRDIVAHMNSVFKNCARLVTGEVEFNNTRNVLRSVTLAT